MKTTTLIFLLLLGTCMLSVPGAWANFAFYSDSAENTWTNEGVLGIEYSGQRTGGSAVNGLASAVNGYTYGGVFESLSPSGTGVSGKGGEYGGVFSSSKINGTGVLGMANNTKGYGWGGYFAVFSDIGTGVLGHASSKTGKNYGGYFQSDSESGTAVYGEATATSDTVTNGGRFISASTKGVGVYGLAKAKTGKTYGGNFLSDSSEGVGVYGAARALEGVTYGGFFRTYSKKGKAVYGYAKKDDSGKSGVGGYFISEGEGIGIFGESLGETSGASWGGYFTSSSDRGNGVLGIAFGENGIGVRGQSPSPNGYGVYSDGNMKVEGKFTCTGTKSAVVKLKNGEGVSLYAVEASENWFEDFGSAKLKDGAAVVAIDPIYSETVNTEIDYHVFLTPRGECKGLYVTNQKGSSFDVRELNGGKSDIPFSYRIVAKRKGYEDVRLAKVKEETLTAMTTPEGDSQTSEVLAVHRKAKR